MTVRPFLRRRGVSACFQMDASVIEQETATSKAQSYESVVNHNPLYQLPAFLGLWVYILFQL